MSQPPFRARLSEAAEAHDAECFRMAPWKESTDAGSFEAGALWALSAPEVLAMREALLDAEGVTYECHVHMAGSMESKLYKISEPTWRKIQAALAAFDALLKGSE